MRLATKRRLLSPKEIALATRVFGASLGPWRRIFITDGLGPIPTKNNPYADVEMNVFYLLNLGPDIYPDATIPRYLKNFGRYDSTFIHELTHVWQYQRGYWVILSSLVANLCKHGYQYASGLPWDSYNVEQQASIVEDWYEDHMSTTDRRFVYIDKIIRPGVGKSSIADRIKINATPEKLKSL